MSARAIALGQGQPGADRGKAAIFVYDAASINVVSASGSDGASGAIDIAIPITKKYCAAVNDLNNARSAYDAQAMTPSVTLAEVDYGLYSVTLPTTALSRTYNNAAAQPYIFKRVDSSVRDWIAQLAGN
jgi:hypothetical protein